MLDNLDPTTSPTALLAFWLIMLISFLLGWFLAVFYLKNRYIPRNKELATVIRDTTDSVHPTEKIPTVEIKDEVFDITSPPNGIKAIQTRGRSGAAILSDDIVIRPAGADKKKEKPILNFNNIGEADETNKDDLKKIMGIGPFIEKKLNDIGIFTFEQISRFTDEDMNTVTELIEFFPGRIKRDDWKGQAKALFIQEQD